LDNITYLYAHTLRISKETVETYKDIT
jgi:hypothetical protein